VDIIPFIEVLGERRSYPNAFDVSAAGKPEE
jgi:hypothetical protein